MNSKYDVYLAGSMTGRPVGEVRLERAEACAVLSTMGLTWYDPAENEGLERLDPQSLISNAFDRDRMEAFVKKDLAAVAASRAVLHLTGDLASEGSNWEMAYAVWQRQIPVHLVAPLRVLGVKMSFTNILVDGVHENLYFACKAIKNVLHSEER